jgi:hypothetical protein
VKLNNKREKKQRNSKKATAISALFACFDAE